MGDCGEDIQLEVSRWVPVRSVDTLTRTNQCHPMKLKFGDDLGQMAERTSNAVELECKNDVHLSPTDSLHEVVQPISIPTGPRGRVPIPLYVVPPSPAAVFPQLGFLAVVDLILGADSKVDGDSWLHEKEALKITPKFTPGFCVDFHHAENLQFFSVMLNGRQIGRRGMARTLFQFAPPMGRTPYFESADT